MDDRAADPQEWQEAIAEYEEQQGDNNDDFAVWPENWQTVRVFMSLSRCWRQDRMSGHFLGLPRADIESTLTMWNIRRTHQRRILESLVIMEGAALEVLNRGK